jgi:hypothetical protein
MTIAIRIVLASLLLPAFVVVTRSVTSGMRAARVVLLVGAMSASLATLIRPQLWTVAATSLGLNSGLDLIVYSLGFGLFLHIAYSLGKIRRLEDRMAVLTRELAILKYFMESEQRNQGNRGAPDELERP